MSNRDTEAARAYHEATKLNYINLNNKPPLYKSYSGLPVIPLPQSDLGSAVSTLDALTSPMAVAESSLDLPGLARILYLSAGLIRKAVLPVAGEVHYRAAASAGALYPVEIYLVCMEVPGLAAGIYHFSPAEFSLVRLREGDYRGTLADALADPAVVASTPASLVLSTNFWRSAWKYRVRSYRYCYWDAGTILANMLASSSATGLAAQVVAGFVDEEVNRLLGLESDQEAAVCVVPLGPPRDNPVPPLSYPADSVDPGSECLDAIEVEIDYPEIEEIHWESSLEQRSEGCTLGERLEPLPASPCALKRPLPCFGDLPKYGRERSISRRRSIGGDDFAAGFHPAVCPGVDPSGQVHGSTDVGDDAGGRRLLTFGPAQPPGNILDSQWG